MRMAVAGVYSHFFRLKQISMTSISVKCYSSYSLGVIFVRSAYTSPMWIRAPGARPDFAALNICVAPLPPWPNVDHQFRKNNQKNGMREGSGSDFS